MDPATLQFMLAALGQRGILGGAKGAAERPAPIAPPATGPITNIPTNPAYRGGVPPGLSHTMGMPTGDALPASPTASAPPALAGLSNLRAALQPGDFELGAALLGGPGAGGASAEVEDGPPGIGAPPASLPGAVDPSTGEGPAGAVGAGPSPMSGLFAGLGGVKAPPPVTPIMGGGNVGGARPPDVTARMGVTQSQIPALLQMLFGGGAGRQGLPVPALGQLLRGA